MPRCSAIEGTTGSDRPDWRTKAAAIAHRHAKTARNTGNVKFWPEAGCNAKLTIESVNHIVVQTARVIHESVSCIRLAISEWICARAHARASGDGVERRGGAGSGDVNQLESYLYRVWYTPVYS